MFYNLSKKFSKIIQKISNIGRITKKDIKQTLREIRITLLEADVALSVIQKIIKNVKKKILDKPINNNLTPGQEFIKLIKRQLIKIMIKKNNKLNLDIKKTTRILIIGPQGSGKTTNLIKIGNLLKKKHKKKILIISTDNRRVSAIEQFKILGEKNNLDLFLTKKKKPLEIYDKAIKYARTQQYKIVLIDTSGVLHNNIKLMKELKILQKRIKPIETLFVMDSMTGQDSINIIKSYNKNINITGVILTKMDSNARGGIALSCSYLTKIPIKFISNGENVNSIDSFCPKKIVNRILGMEDFFSIIKKIEYKDIKEKKIEKIKKNFNLNDFLQYIKKIEKNQNLSFIIKKISKNNNLKKEKNEINNNIFKELEAIINSMTLKERKNPKIIKNSRKKRISKGSGVKIQKINILLKKFFNIKKIMTQIKKNSIYSIYNKIRNFLPNSLF